MEDAFEERRQSVVAQTLLSECFESVDEIQASSSGENSYTSSTSSEQQVLHLLFRRGG